MLQLAIHKYYTFFDETISSSTFIVLMITCLIFAVGSMSTSVHANNYKWSITEALKYPSSYNTVMIDGIEYKLEFTKIVSK